jgi:catechol 2,3-dioxygenase-like lactoylglutathione lyase family enzyme
VARVVGISLDCADPQRLADFYRALLGGRQLWAKETSVGVEVPGAVLVAQRIEAYVPPAWPGTSIVHLDLTAEDLGAAAARATTLGATRPEQPDPRWLVLLDPAGHPFCLTPFTPASVARSTLDAPPPDSRPDARDR